MTAELQQDVVNPFAQVPGPVDYGEFSFKVTRQVLADLCERASAAVSARESQQRPDLSCFQFRLGGPVALQVAATDLDRVVLAGTDAVAWDDSAPEAVAYIPARRLLAMLKEAAPGDVSIAVAKNKATVTVAGGTSWELRLPGASAYPQLPVPADFGFQSCSREKLLAALRSVRHAVCRDGSLANLTQVAITQVHTTAPDGEQDASAFVTATDASRLARAELPGFPQAFCIPGTVLDDLVRLLAGLPVDSIEVGQTAKQIAVRAGYVLFAAAKRSTPFPEVDSQLLKKAAKNSETVTVERDALAAAVRRVRITADAGSAAIALRLSPESIEVVSRDGDDSARETVAGKWDGPGASRLVVVSHVALAEALAVHPGQSCELRLGKDEGKRRSVVLLAGEGVTQVLSQLPPGLAGF